MMVFEDPPDDSAREIQTAKMGCHAACMCVTSAHIRLYLGSRASRGSGGHLRYLYVSLLGYPFYSTDDRRTCMFIRSILAIQALPRAGEQGDIIRTRDPVQTLDSLD